MVWTAAQHTAKSHQAAGRCLVKVDRKALPIVRGLRKRGSCRPRVTT